MTSLLRRPSGLVTRGREGWPSGALGIVAVALVLTIVDVVAVPILFLEQATDWRSYEDGARLLATGGSLYRWASDPNVRAITDYPYLYPPPLAAIWSLGMTPELFAILKTALVSAMAAFAAALQPVLPRRTVVISGMGVVALTLATPPVLHDLALGNVMTLYLAAIALVVALPGRWWAGVPLGILVAIALKPAIAPILLWLVLARRPQFVAAAVAGLVTTGLFALILGAGPYIEYAAALPRLGGLAQPFSGNLGLSAIATWLAVVAIPFGIGWTVWAGRSLTPFASAAVAIGATVVVQPALGLNYGSLLIPGVAALWFVNRPAAFGLALMTPLIVLFSPPLAGLAIAAIATVVGSADAIHAAEPAVVPVK